MERLEKQQQKMLSTFRDAIEKRAGRKIGASLGEGDMGVAYSASGGAVFKITKDETEAVASYHVLKCGRSFKNVVRVYDVFQLKSDKKEANTAIQRPLYCILQDEVKVVSPNQKNCDALELVYDFWARYYSNDWYGSTSKSFLKKFYQYYKEKKSKARMQTKIKELFDSIVKSNGKLSKEQEDLIKQVGNGLLELWSIGVNFFDTHAGNVGQKDGVFKIIDIGVSESPQIKVPFLMKRTT